MTALGANPSDNGPANFATAYQPIPEHEPLAFRMPRALGNAWTDIQARRHLNRLERRLNRLGWESARRYECSPPLLRIFSEAAPHIGEHLAAVRGPDRWSYWTSTGAYLADCKDPADAAHALTTRLGPWLVAVLTAKPVQD
ncbi:hypothetical protein [Actinomadura rupiterrae]|uniref:hypothetical protein n=1 Tax=Actinomadura rupiterrae TaxID=559627 RepID=UPI0020A5FB30|nr:hypothetical protein [Actinomadura rupiterrae]MCP2338590.1 hypothetical protein [Actinomadura rupiterrae]